MNHCRYKSEGRCSHKPLSGYVICAEHNTIVRNNMFKLEYEITIKRVGTVPSYSNIARWA